MREFLEDLAGIAALVITFYAVLLIGHGLGLN